MISKRPKAGGAKKRRRKTVKPEKFEFKCGKIVLRASGRTFQEACTKAYEKFPPTTPQEIKGGRTRRIIIHYRREGRKAWTVIIPSKLLKGI